MGPLRGWSLVSTLFLQRYIGRIRRNSERPARPKVGTHYHVGTVHGYTMRGHWRYLEHDWIAKPGTYIHEPAGEAHTLVITEDSPEPMIAMFVVEGGLIYLDKAEHGAFAAYEDGFSASRTVSEVLSGTPVLMPGKLDLLVR